MFEKVKSRYTLSDDERESARADLDRLTALRDRARKAMEGATLSLVQRESCRKAVPAVSLYPPRWRCKLSGEIAAAQDIREYCRLILWSHCTRLESVECKIQKADTRDPAYWRDWRKNRQGDDVRN